MSDTETLAGACHCGKVRVRIPGDAVGVVVCHCGDCQRLHGNAFAMVVTDQVKVQWEGEGSVRWYRSSPENERGFCAECGSRIAKRPVEGARIMLSAGLFHPLDRKVVRNLWVEGKPGWYEAPRVGPLAPEHRAHAGALVLLELALLRLVVPVEEPVDAVDREARHEAAAKRQYSPYDKDKAAGKPLLFTVVDDNAPDPDTDEARFAASTSMRDVEPSVHLWIERRSLGGRR